MSRNKTILVIISAVLLLIMLFATLTEYKEVPVHQWRESYSYNDEQPQGLYIFKELAIRYFKDIPNTVNGFPEDTINSKSLYIQFVPDHMEYSTTSTLIEIARAGNDVLIISDFYNDDIAESLDLYLTDSSVKDSSMYFNFTDSALASDTNYLYSFHNRNFEALSLATFHLMEDNNYDYVDKEYIKVSTPNGLIVMIAIPVGEGRVFYHVKKDLFYNYSYRQNQLFEYTQKIFSNFKPQHLYLLNPITTYSSAKSTSENPLDFIMSQPALKAAYYLLILGILLYVFFGGKRKQKIIPVSEVNKNTSLEYIETVSQLFYQQGQHEKLVSHMRNIFHHKMQKRFFLAPDNPNYLEVLAKKSKISKTELQYVIDRFKNLDDDSNFRGDQLVSLNRRLENIYKEIENN
jgi:hypothetical protein